MASDNNAATLEYHKMQLVGSLNALAHNMRECAAIAEAFVHTLNYGANPPPFPPMGVNGQYPMAMVPMPVAHEDGKKRKARGGDDNEVKKRAKKIKDPNAPKRPASSYILFQNDVRSELRKKNPEMRNNELLSHIAKLWAEMPQEQKEAYEARNRAEKDKWLAEKAIYESAGKPGEPSGVPIAPVPVAVPIKAAAPPTVVATPSSTEDTSGDEDSSEDSSSDIDDAAVPPPKKSKREAAVANPAKEETTPKKEKKHKKAKA